jgi:glycosyltransferase involved in cell wall biosynthesis
VRANCPPVTVIIPNYNHAKTLPLCLKAVLEQTYPTLEIVVVDDCSTDDSAKIAESMGVQVIRTPTNGGPAVARNFGANWASGETLFFVDSDVALAPDAVATAVALLSTNQHIGAVCGIEAPEPLIRGSRINDYRTLQHHYWAIGSAGEVSFLWSAMFAIRAALFAKLGPFNPLLRYTEEVDYGHRIGLHHSILSTPAVHGRIDHDHRLGPLLRKLFHRGRLRVPLYARRRRFAQGYETAQRAWASLAALLAVTALAPSLALGLKWTALPALLFAISLACDAGMYRFVFARRCPLFAGFFVVVHFLVNLVVASSVIIGALQWTTSAKFRKIYDMPAASVSESGGEHSSGVAK